MSEKKMSDLVSVKLLFHFPWNKIIWAMGKKKNSKEKIEHLTE